MNNGKNESYPFWDLIAQEAYLSGTEELQKNTWARFTENEFGKRIWLFACNEANKELIRLYGEKWDIVGVLDNAEAMWGKDFCGIKVYSPTEIVPSLSKAQDVVILSLRLNADVVYHQLTKMGFYNIYSLGVMIAGIEPYKTFISEMDRAKHSPLEDIVLMESTNDFDGNTGALYEFLRKKGVEHKFIWITKRKASENNLLDDRDEVIYPEDIESIKKYMRYRIKAKWEIWDNYEIRKVRPDQINVFLQHYGMGYKMIRNWYHAPSYVDYVLTPNKFVRELEQDAIDFPQGCSFIYGELPRNDALYKKDWKELEKLTQRKFSKTVLWAPTLRESARFNRVDSDIEYPFGISLIYKEKDMHRLNDWLKGTGILLVIKPHPRQKLNYEDKDYENIIYLTADRVKNIHAYGLLTQMDALITDYSSIVFDYMLLDRPCAWVLEDREHYKIDYLMENPEEYMPGEKIYTIDDLYRFLTDVRVGRDPYREERQRVCAICNPPFEGRGCERLAEVLGL